MSQDQTLQFDLLHLLYLSCRHAEARDNLDGLRHSLSACQRPTGKPVAPCRNSAPGFPPIRRPAF
uniref:Uncharacterized protein n=1 Tax=uncultured delta proteobacterium HF0010_01J10 TaxID=710820 RepID=E0XQD6_9DELT|nr:hypothetical protein [uncultured delta proteobacterium HF0010_01J10]